jgi:hypothetical protein
MCEQTRSSRVRQTYRVVAVGGAVSCIDGCLLRLPSVLTRLAVTLCALCRPEVVAETIRGAINTKLIEPGTEIVSIYHRRLVKECLQ